MHRFFHIKIQRKVHCFLRNTFKDGTLFYLFSVLYVDNGAFTFEDRAQMEKRVELIFYHFTKFGLEMHIVREGKPSKTECVFFPPPGFFSRRQILLDTYKEYSEAVVPRQKEKRESHETKCKREDSEYMSLAETATMQVADGYITFCKHFKYLGIWVSYSLRDDYDISKRVAATNAAMGALEKFWIDDHVDM